jgi:hypothetical protein
MGKIRNRIFTTNAINTATGLKDIGSQIRKSLLKPNGALNTGKLCKARIDEWYTD